MGTQAIIFTYEGQEPTRETIRSMAEALLNSDIGVNTATLQNHNLNEAEYAQALVGAAVKKPSKGLSIKIERAPNKIVLGDDKKEKIINFFSELING